MSPAGSSNAPEARARARIDQALTDAGWTLQDRDDMNLAAASAIAVREFKLDRGHGYVDYCTPERGTMPAHTRRHFFPRDGHCSSFCSSTESP